MCGVQIGAVNRSNVDDASEDELSDYSASARSDLTATSSQTSRSTSSSVMILKKNRQLKKVRSGQQELLVYLKRQDLRLEAIEQGIRSTKPSSTTSNFIYMHLERF